MNAVQEIKRKYDEAVQAEMDELLEVLRPAMELNVQRRREEETCKAREARRKRVRNRRKANINAALHNAGIPLRVL
jgi:hypothetical protein